MMGNCWPWSLVGVVGRWWLVYHLEFLCLLVSMFVVISMERLLNEMEVYLSSRLNL